MRIRIGIAFCPVLAAAASPAAAQVIPDLQEVVVRGEQLNRGIDEAARARGGERDEDDGEIDGEAGIYVLTVNDIFQLTASGGLGYTSNPQRTADDLGGSGFGDFAVSAGIATRLGGAVDFGLSANVSGREFFEQDAPSSRNASLSLSLGVPVAGPVYASVVGFGGYSFDGAFKNGTSFRGLSGSLSAAFPVTNSLVIRPGIGATRQWAEVEENNSSVIAASVDVIYALAPRLTATVRGSAARRWYDDFYEDVTFVERRDTLYGVTAALSFRPSDNIAITANLSYERQNSRFFLAAFDALESSAGVSLRVRF